MNTPNAHRRERGARATRVLVPFVVALLASCEASSDGADGGFEIEADCRAACASSAECLDADEAACAQGCGVLDLYYDANCVARLGATMRCQASLSCSEVVGFAEAPLEHAECGADYRAYLEECTTDAGEPPAECDAYCAAGEACAPERVRGGCPYSCTDALGAISRVNGRACEALIREYFGCLASLGCDELVQALDGAVAESCRAVVDSNPDACR